MTLEEEITALVRQLKGFDCFLGDIRDKNNNTVTGLLIDKYVFADELVEITRLFLRLADLEKLEEKK